MTCDNIRDFFAEALYGELDERRRMEFDHHLGSCRACREEFGAMRQTLDLLDRRTRVEPTAAEWTRFDRSLEAKLLEEGARFDGRTAHAPAAAGGVDPIPASVPPSDPLTVPRRPRRTFVRLFPVVRPAWSYGFAAALLLAAGFFIGRNLFNGAPDAAPSGSGRDAPPREASATPETGADEAPSAGAGPEAEADRSGRPAAVPHSGSRPGTPVAPGSRTAMARTDPETQARVYLERSRNLLIGLSNLDDRQAAAIDLAARRRVSRELYDRGNAIAVALDRPSQSQLRELVQQLQIILLQLSNMGAGDGRPAVELVRQGVGATSILLRINLEAIQSALEAESEAAAADSVRRSL